MPTTTDLAQLIAEAVACSERLLNHPPACREFRVIRRAPADANGRASAEVLGVGVVFPSGRTVMEWVAAPDLIEIWPSVERVLALHRDGCTEVIFRDEPV